MVNYPKYIWASVSLGLALLLFLHPHFPVYRDLTQIVENDKKIVVLNKPMVPSTHNGIANSTNSTVEYWPTIDWLESTPKEQGMSSKRLDQMKEFIIDQQVDKYLDSVLVIRNGYLVLEMYPSSYDYGFTKIPKYNQNMTHILHSVTKSFTSALIGIAIQQGLIDNITQKVVDFFPGRTIENLDSRKQNMTLEHLLTMTTGFEWDEWSYPYTDSRNILIQMINSGNAVQFMLNRPMASNPGEDWVYCTGASHLLSAIIKQVTGYNALNFARDFLFGPLGIISAIWSTDSQGINYGGSELRLTPRDMAKFGFLFLNNGTWDGQQIVLADWVTNSTKPHFNFNFYGYQWWLNPLAGLYHASGVYGQEIFVVPNHNLVVVFTGDFKNENPENQLLFNYILPAVTDGIDLEGGGWILGFPVILIGFFSITALLGIISVVMQKLYP